jgi:hypothetical protein
MIKIKIVARFINEHQGGWRDLPADIKQYACTIRVLDVENLDIEQEWSLIIQIEAYHFETGKFRGRGRFIADVLPENLIAVGKSVELYEGSQFVGHGVIVDVE